MRPRPLARTLPRWLLAAALAVAAAPAPGAITATLAHRPERDADAAPFRAARLTIDATGADDGVVVRGVSLREARGGPTFVYGTTVAAGTRQTLDVELPAVSQEQKYLVEFLAEDAYPAAVLARATAEIHWPGEQLADLVLFDPQAYAPWREDLPAWGAPLRRSVFVVLVLTCLGAASAGLIRSPALRAGVLVLVSAAGAGAAAWVLQDAETLVRREADDGTLLVLRCRRTVAWRTPQTRLVPIYVNAWHMRQDNMIVHAGNQTRLELSPRNDAHRVRLFRRRKPKPG